MWKKERKQRKHAVPLFIEFMEGELKRARARCRQSTCDNYATARRSFSLFMQGRDIAVADMSQELMKRYSRWLEGRNVCLNTVSCYMRSLRAMYNIAVRRYRLRQRSPFAGVFTGNAVTAKRALGEDGLRRMKDAGVPENTFADLSRDVFMFCFYAMGMPFTDAVALKKTQVCDGVITYRRRKTGKAISVRVEPCMRRIIDKYGGTDSEYVFPLHDGIAAAGKSGYYALLRRYNRELLRLAREAGVASRVTSYVPRHTWASMAHRQNVPLSLISQALGHSVARTTLIYIKGHGVPALARANKKIIDKIMCKPMCKNCCT